MRVRFTRTVVVDDSRKGTADEERYEAGQVVDLPEPSARRWINRSVAEEVSTAAERAAVQQSAEVVVRTTPGKSGRRDMMRPKTQV